MKTKHKNDPYLKACPTTMLFNNLPLVNKPGPVFRLLTIIISNAVGLLVLQLLNVYDPEICIFVIIGTIYTSYQIEHDEVGRRRILEKYLTKNGHNDKKTS